MLATSVEVIRTENVSEGVAAPLMESSSMGAASTAQTLGNILVSILGTGILGLPFTFNVASWAAGLLGVFIVAVSSFYCMLPLVSSFIYFLFVSLFSRQSLSAVFGFEL